MYANILKYSFYRIKKELNNSYGNLI
jgi:hypothetical protein